MGEKKKKEGRSLSLIQKAILLLSGFCLSYFLLIGFSYLPGVRSELDFAVRKRAKIALDNAFPSYQIETVSADRKSEIDNTLTVGYISKEVIRQVIQERNAQQQAYIQMPFKNFQIRIREFFITPMLLIMLLFLFTPIRWKVKLLGLLGAWAVLYGLLTMKLRAITKFEINRAYFPESNSLLQDLTPFFSSPGLVFLTMIIIWMAIILPFVNFKKLSKLIQW